RGAVPGKVDDRDPPALGALGDRAPDLGARQEHGADRPQAAPHSLTIGHLARTAHPRKLRLGETVADATSWTSLFRNTSNATTPSTASRSAAWRRCFWPRPTAPTAPRRR